jgi:hypothetical protein
MSTAKPGAASADARPPLFSPSTPSPAGARDGQSVQGPMDVEVAHADEAHGEKRKRAVSLQSPPQASPASLPQVPTSSIRPLPNALVD